jgi:hypothetical protein
VARPGAGNSSAVTRRRTWCCEAPLFVATAAAEDFPTRGAATAGFGNGRPATF